MLLQAGTLQGVPEGRPEAPAFFWSPTGGDASFFTSITRGEFARLVQDLKAAIANYASAGATCAMSMGRACAVCATDQRGPCAPPNQDAGISRRLPAQTGEVAATHRSPTASLLPPPLLCSPAANGLEFCTAFLAVSGLRACAMPINPAYTKVRRLPPPVASRDRGAASWKSCNLKV